MSIGSESVEVVTVEELLDGLLYVEQMSAFIRERLAEALSGEAMELRVGLPEDGYQALRKLFKRC